MASPATPNPEIQPPLVPFGTFGPRAAPVNVEYPVATLVVGLGQVGWHAVSLLSQMAQAAIPKTDTARIQYFAIARRPSVIPDNRLGRDHQLLLTTEETDWVAIPGRYSGAGVARWWPKPLRDKTLITDFSTVRAYGRLLLFENPTFASELLAQRVEQLMQTAQRPGSDGRCSILILSSIAEAEGSGLLFDVTAHLRTLTSDINCTVTGILTADSGAIDDAARTLAMANSYATLKEMDSIMAAPGHYHIGLPLSGNIKNVTKTYHSHVRPFDYLLLTGDAGRVLPTGVPLAAPLAEMGITWMLANTNREHPPLPPLSATEKSERFDGYTIFNVSKLALPTGAASDLVGSRLALQLVAALSGMAAQNTISEWVGDTRRRFRNDMMIDTLLSDTRLHERLNDLLRRVRVDALTNEIARVKDKQDFSLRRMADDIIRRLDTEDKATEMIDEGRTARRLDTIRSRSEDLLDKNVREIENQLQSLPTQLACIQGRGLHWMAAALDQLSAELNRTLNELRQDSSAAEHTWQENRRRALAICYDHDEKYSGVKRLLRGSSAKDLQDIATALESATVSATERIRLSAGVSYWQRLWEAIDSLRSEVRLLLQQLDRVSKSITATAEMIRDTMDVAAAQPVTFPAGTLVDGEWFKRGAAAAMPRSDLPPDQLITKIWRLWAGTVPAPDRRVDKFLRDLLLAARLSLMQSFQFSNAVNFALERKDNSTIRAAMVEFQKAANPLWTPSREIPGWSTFEFLRGGQIPGRGALIPVAPNSPWHRREIPAPDQDEITLIRMAHRVPAEALEALKSSYRRAYERIAAEGVPLHIDRRMDATLPDLIRNTALAEVSEAWERALRAAQGGPHEIRGPLVELVRMLAVALGVDMGSVQRVPTNSSDFVLTIFPLPTFRLRLPPAQCPVVFSYSTRRPRELGQAIYQQVSNLGLPEPFIFIVNVNNRPDMDVVVETLRTESYNVVVLDEPIFKRIVGSRQPLVMLGEVVLSEVDLTLVSPFYTKAPVPERMFYGRDREIKDVRRKIKTHSVSLIGGRRIGKTSTLQQIERVLSAPDSGQQPYYLDCHNSMSYQHFFSAIRRRWNIATATPDPTAFEDVVRDLKMRHPDKQLIFLFDEVDRLLITDQQQEHSELLFRTFRSLSNEGACQFIFSGERWLARAMGDSFSALFNFALPVPLVLLEKPVVARLVAEPFEMMNIWLEDAPALINRIYEVSAGHPNIVQTICQEMVIAIDSDRGNVGLLNVAHMNSALHNHKLQEEIINTFWGQMSHLARVVTLVWPDDQRQLTLEDMLQLVRGVGLRSISVADMQEAMKDLELYLFVRPTGRYYELVPVDFPHLLDEMTIKGLEISAMIEKIESQQKKEIFNK